MTKAEFAETQEQSAPSCPANMNFGRTEMPQAQRSLIAILLLFAVAALPCLFWPLMPHPDERRYSIAAAQMIASGDVFLPISETGEIRLKKPPLTYWYLLPGFALLGETLAGAKALFLASALGIIATAFATARSLGATPMASVLAAATVAGHGIFFSTSTQHIPDMPLVLGLSVALWGAMHVFGSGPVKARHWAALWLGLSWAVLAKGLLPILLAVLILVLLAVPDRTRAPADQRARRAATGWGFGALAATSAWFVWIGVSYPEVMMREFLGDQVTDKAGFEITQILAGLRKTVMDLALPTLPVLLALAIARYRRKSRNTPRQTPRRSVLLLWLWCASVVVLFAFSTQLYERYILPALPAYAALLALFASRLETAALANGVRRSVRIWLWLPVTMAVLAALVAWRFGSVGLAVLTVACAATGAVLLWTVAARISAGLVALALILPLTEIARLPVFWSVIAPTAGEVARAAEAPAPGTRLRLVFDDAKLVDEIGLMTGGLTRLSLRDTYDPARDQAVTAVYFLDPVHLAPLKAAGFEITEHPILRDLNLDWPALRKAFAHGNRDMLAVDHGETLFVAVKEP